jgi:hypothetical protein
MPFKQKTHRGEKILLILWVVISVAYVGYGEYNRFQRDAIDLPMQKGKLDAITQIISGSQKSCQQIPLVSDEGEVKVVNINCLRAAGGGNGQ